MMMINSKENSGIVREMQECEKLHVMAIWAAYVQKYHSFLSDEWMAETRFLMANQYLPACEMYVYEYNGRLVGFVGMVENYLGLLFVESQYEGLGFAKALLNKVNERAGDVFTSAYSSNSDGCAFYERHGFTFVKEDCHDISSEKMSHYVLHKS